MIINSIIIDYNIKKYPFREILCKEVFKVHRLEHLHKYWLKQLKKDKLCYNDNLLLRKLMQNIPDTANFYRIYHAWINNVIASKYGYKISYSMHPKMRVHLAHTGSVSNFHRDVDVTGQEEQINVYLPFTNVFDSCTIWVAKKYYDEEFVPVNLKYGQAIIWDGGHLKHGSIHNNTNSTRVSCDFRFKYFDKNLVSKPYSEVLAGR